MNRTKSISVVKKKDNIIPKGYVMEIVVIGSKPKVVIRI